MSALKKTIDSDDEDGDVIVQARNRSRATRQHQQNSPQQSKSKSRDLSDAKIKLLNVNIEFDQSRLPANERASNNKTEEVGKAVASSNLATDKDKQLEQALEDKRKLLDLLGKVKRSFEGFKQRHAALSH